MRLLHYILNDDGEPEAADLLTWARWFEDWTRRIVLLDTIGDVKISTVFLGLDHAFDGGPPVLWETMVFGGPLDQTTQRYTSKLAALEGHAALMQQVEAALMEPKQ